MKTSEFWSSTDEELNALVDLWRDREKRKDHRVARHLALHANLNRDRKKRPNPYTEADFIPQSEAEIQQHEETVIERAIAKRDSMMLANPHMFKKAE